MKWVVLIIVIIGALALLRKIAELKGWIPESGALPYEKKETLLNPAEQAMYLLLIEAVPNYIVFAQVQMAGIIEIRKGMTNSEWQSWFNKINQKSIDFVICDKAMVVKACIELDGKTHEQAKRKKADADKNAALNAAGIPMLRFKPAKMPTVEELRKQIGEKLIAKKT